MNRRDFLKSAAAAGALPLQAARLRRSILGANTAMAGYGLYPAIEAVRKLGFHTIEIHPMGQPEPTPGRFPGFEFDRLPDDEKRKIRRALAGFEHVTTHLPYTGLNWFSRDEEEAGASIRKLETAMAATAFFGAELAVLHVMPPKGRSLEEAWPRMISRLRQWGDVAAKGKYRLGIETGFPSSVADFTRLIREIDHAAVGCTVDVGHQRRYRELGGARAAARACDAGGNRRVQRYHAPDHR